MFIYIAFPEFAGKLNCIYVFKTILIIFCEHRAPTLAIAYGIVMHGIQLKYAFEQVYEWRGIRKDLRFSYTTELMCLDVQFAETKYVFWQSV